MLYEVITNSILMYSIVKMKLVKMIKMFFEKVILKFLYELDAFFVIISKGNNTLNILPN